MTAWSAPGRPSSPPSGAEARVKRQKHLQTNGSGNTLANRDRRLTRGARLRYSDRRSGTRIDDLHNFQRRGAEPKTASLRGSRGRADPGLTPKATGAPIKPRPPPRSARRYAGSLREAAALSCTPAAGVRVGWRVRGR